MKCRNKTTKIECFRKKFYWICWVYYSPETHFPHCWRCQTNNDDILNVTIWNVLDGNVLGIACLCNKVSTCFKKNISVGNGHAPNSFSMCVVGLRVRQSVHDYSGWIQISLQYSQLEIGRKMCQKAEKCHLFLWKHRHSHNEYKLNLYTLKHEI